MGAVRRCFMDTYVNPKYPFDQTVFDRDRIRIFASVAIHDNCYATGEMLRHERERDIPG